MIVNYKIFATEPIENVITCMHHKVDKQVCFGYHDLIQKRKNSTKEFLENHCSVQKTEFVELSDSNLQTILKTMRGEIQRELDRGSKIFFDITGGESLLLVAFGMLAKEYNAPIHLYDIPTDKLIELEEGAELSLSEEADEQHVRLNLDNFIKLQGGIINYELQSVIKSDINSEFSKDVEKMWEIQKKYVVYWNPFCYLFKLKCEADSLVVKVSMQTLLKELSASNNSLNNIEILNEFVDALKDEGIIKNVSRSEKLYSFSYKNEKIKAAFSEGGSVLELHTYLKQKKNSDDCKVGVHLDWDGVIEGTAEDVLNEIDVLSIKGNIPTFISCKSGKSVATKATMSLYELDSVAERFGGKYAKKVFISAVGLTDIDAKRAVAMGIEVIT